ncbi:hypothetical protein [Streptomyces sp. NRRL F-5053]|uniref:hypothetical protein n=1 Tax=Streptomyces sp. NRRL F-5053 TaxID=1463854 RepID=UPI0004CB297F|nr:hypothetical protein [Streptomyces sp. NRRL F-5053]
MTGHGMNLFRKNGNKFFADDAYVAASKQRREEIRLGVAEVVKTLFVQGSNGEFGDGAVGAEHICNPMWDLENTLSRWRRTVPEPGPAAAAWRER